MLANMKVVYFQRKPAPVGTYSIEFIFDDVRKRLRKNIDSKVKVSRYLSQGLKKRLYNTVEAALRQRGDVNHVTGDTHYLTLLLRKDKTVLTIHDCGFMNEDRSALSKELYRALWLKIPTMRAQKVTANSQVTKDDIVKYTKCDPDKITVIPVAISQRYQKNPKPFNKDKPNFLFIGSSANKNLARLIEALENISCRLTIIGNLPDDHRALLKAKQVEFENRVNLTDAQMLEAYESADALLFPSTFEGFGMPIVEAQSVGRAVLTANVASMPFVAGEGAILIDPFSVDSIRDGVQKLIENDDEREQMIESGFENVKRFDPDVIAQRYLDVYSSL